jgi:GAF domain-containing protein
MTEEIKILHHLSKVEKYAALFPQLAALTADEEDRIANMANVSAALKETFGFFWVGFYIVSAEELVLGPFQGPVACTRIAKGKGVCGSCWEKEETIIVPDVNAFPGHIACNAASLSEIVVPVMHNNKIVAILDIDSDQLNDFDETDKEWLEKIVTVL